MLKALIEASFKLIKAISDKSGFVARRQALKNNSFYVPPYAEGPTRTFLWKGIAFKYVVNDGYAKMNEPVHSFTCPECGMSMRYRLFGRYKCESPDCGHKAKTGIWGGVTRLYPFIRRKIQLSIGG